MKLLALPTSKDLGMYGMLPAFLDKVEKKVKLAAADDATTMQAVAAWAITAIALPLIATVNIVVNALALAAKAVPVAFNVTIGRLTGLDKYTSPECLTGEDFLGGFQNIRQSFLITYVTLPVFFFMIARPESVVAVAKDVKLLPLAKPSKDSNTGRVQTPPSGSQDVTATAATGTEVASTAAAVPATVAK